MGGSFPMIQPAITKYSHVNLQTFIDMTISPLDLHLSKTCDWFEKFLRHFASQQIFSPNPRQQYTLPGNSSQVEFEYVLQRRNASLGHERDEEKSKDLQLLLVWYGTRKRPGHDATLGRLMHFFCLVLWKSSGASLPFLGCGPAFAYKGVMCKLQGDNDMNFCNKEIQDNLLSRGPKTVEIWNITPRTHFPSYVTFIRSFRTLYNKATI